MSEENAGAPSRRVEDVAGFLASELRAQCNIDEVVVMTVIVGTPDGRLIPVTYPSNGGPLQQLKILATATNISVDILQRTLVQGVQELDPEDLKRMNREAEERRLRKKFGVS